MKTDEYESIFSKDIDIDKLRVLYDITNLEFDNQEIPNHTFLNKETLEKLESQSIQLIGEENYNRIVSYYLKLVNEVAELTDEHSSILNDYITETLKDQKKENYIKVKKSDYLIFSFWNIFIKLFT